MGRMINSRNLSAYLYALMFAVPGAQINQTMTNTLFAPTNSNSNNNHNKSSPSNGERERDGDAELSSTWSLKTCGAFASEKARTCCHLGPQVPMPLPLTTLRHSPRASEAPPSRGYHLRAKPVRNTAECGTKIVISLSFGYRYFICGAFECFTVKI